MCSHALPPSLTFWHVHKQNCVMPLQVPSSAIVINCTAEGTPINFAVLGFKGMAGSGAADGLVVFEVSMPNGGTGLQMRTATPGGDSNPPQFAPYPAFDLSASAALDNAVSMCYGSERPHMLVENGVRAMPDQCMSLAGGMAGLAWPDGQSPSGLAGAITTAANEFHLSFHRIGEAAGRGGTTVQAWTHGLSGEINEVPTGFAGQIMLYYSPNGINAAVDGWGTSLRQRYKTVKKDAEDPFLQTVSMWTDNGAALNGMDWGTSAAPPVPTLNDSLYIQLNWSMVDESKMGAVIDSIAASGVAPRAAQIDCWWYPTSLEHTYYCGLDWVPPQEFFPNGMAGVHSRLNVPLMLYLPAVCPGGGRWAGRYNWTNTTDQGWVLPVPDEQERFFRELFAYGVATASPHGGGGGSNTTDDPWPNSWVPPMVRAGWAGTKICGYETDFFSNLERGEPEGRTVHGKGEMLLEGIDAAAAAYNLTVQICGGTVPDFLKSLTLPTITNARATNDYDGETQNPTIDGFHNFVAPDNAWPFWGTRMGVSKDNFWTEFTNLTALNFSGTRTGSLTGHDAEVHAVAAALTGIVGIGDWIGATNRTLLHRLARSDGVLLKPDRPLAPMDLMIAGWAKPAADNDTATNSGSSTSAPSRRGLPGSADGARAWSTHVTCTPEDPNAPEITTTPTRRLVSHTGYDATLYRRAPDALDAHPHLLQWLVAGINTTAIAGGFQILAGDLYPVVPIDTPHLAVRSFYDPVCRNGTDPFEGPSKCLELVPRNGDLFDISASPAPCPAAGLCRHILTFHSVFQVVSTTAPVLLGDLGKYASLSGYRFRLVPGQPLNVVVVVGEPNEKVAVSYLVPGAPTPSGWVVRVREVVVGADGRRQITLD
jgi:hypothetical protein